MTDSTKCPVCGRNDIPDYSKEDVRCPSCGSDLKVFRLIDEVESESYSKVSKWKPIAILSLLAAAVFAFLYLTKDPSASLSEAKDRIALLEDSIASLNEHINNPVAEPSTAAAQTETMAEKGQTETKEAGTDNAQATADDGITAPADKVTVKDGKKYYIVRKGDSWWGISQRLYKGKVKDADIAKMNGKKPTDQLEIGQEILVK